MKKLIKYILLPLPLFILFNCSTATLEYTNGITSIRTENNLVDGEKWLREATEIDSVNALPPYQLGKLVFYKQEKWAEMNDMFIIAENRNVDLELNDESFMVNDKVIGTVGEAIKLLRQDAVYKIIQSYIKDKNILTSIKETIKREPIIEGIKEKLKLAINISPNSPEAYCELSDIYKSELDNVSALSTLNNGSNKNPNDWVIQYKLAEYYESVDNLNKSLDACKKSVELGAPSEVYSLMFRLYFDLGQIDSAKEACEILIDRFQDNPQLLGSAFYNKGILYRDIGANSFKIAQDNYFKKNAVNNKESILMDLEDALANLKIAKTNFEDYKYSTDSPDPNIDVLIKETRDYIYKIERKWINRTKEL